MSPELATSLLIAVLGLAAVMALAGLIVFVERRIAGFIQNRPGPNRVGPFGLLQPLADVLKLLFNEDTTPLFGKRTLHTLAPLIPMVTAIAVIAVIPFAGGIVASDINVGVLYLLAVTSLGVYGVTLGGWASNSKYSLLGGLRSAAQMVSYELPMGIAVASCVLYAASLNLVEVVDSQEAWWNIFRNPIGFVIFAIATFAEANRAPFDLVEAEQELVGGFHTEYSGMKFGTFFLAEYMHIIIGSMLIVTFFFGGYHLPFAAYWLPEISATGKVVLDLVVFSLKTFFFIFFFIWVRWTLPRFKFNNLMYFSWSRLLPLGIINFVVIASAIMIYNNYFS